MADTFNRNLELLTVARSGTSAVLGPIGTLDRTTQGLTRSFLATSGTAKSLELFTRTLSGVTGAAVLSFNRTLGHFARSLVAQSPPGTMARRMREFNHSLSGTTGAAGVFNRSPTYLTRSFGGYSPAIGQVARTLQLFQRTMNGASVILITPIALSMNTERQALTSYTNYAFNSFAKFNGVFLGASDAGVFALTGANDDGTVIGAVVRSGVSDFGTSYQKRVSRAYLGYRSDGDMLLRVVTNETSTHDYAVPYRAHTGLHGARVPIGKGLKSRYWQFELQNVAGASFTVDDLEIKPIVLRRRIGGSDA